MVDLHERHLPGFVLLRTYLRSAEGLLDDDGQRELEMQLVANPEAGAVVAGTGGVRKMRVGSRARGKRGGLRVIYYYRAALGRIYLITAFPKSRKADLSMHERQEIRRLTLAIDREGS